MSDQAGGNEEILFKEEQRFRQLWLFLLLLGILVLSVVFIIASSYVQLYQGRPFGDKPMGDTGLIITNIGVLVFGVGLPVMVLGMKLETTVYRDRLNLRFWPFFNRNYHHDNTASCEAQTYRPILDFGGWGLRYSLKHKHWAYNVRGNRGVILQFTNGKKLLVGSQKADEFAAALSKAKKG